MEIELSDEIIKMAGEAGLSEGQLMVLLTGDGEIPDELNGVLEKIADRTCSVQGDASMPGHIKV